MPSRDLTARCPSHWAQSVRPFLQRADEFDEKQPLVAYYLRTYAVSLCMKMRAKEDKEGTSFLVALLGALEKDKEQLEHEIKSTDGRTVLTRFALMLFSKADDMERSGQVNGTTLKLFYTSSLLFEATGQFMATGELDPIAAEKRRYARFISAKIKRCLDRGIPYTPTTDAADVEAARDFSEKPLTGEHCGPLGSGEGRPMLPQEVAPRLAPQSEGVFSAPPPYQPQPSGPPPAPYQPQPSCPPPAPYQPPAPSAPYPPVASSAGAAPSVDQMIDAQKFAKQAVSALQFYDHATAVKTLREALQKLGQK